MQNGIILQIHSYFKIIFSCLMMAGVSLAQDFAKEQQKYPRYRQAIAEKQTVVQSYFEKNGVNYPPSAIFIRAFKHEEEIELWAKNSSDSAFTLIKLFPYCSTSGKLGPKRRQGDMQIPEGFYVIDRFNPNSHFHLSLGLNYPNQSDRILGNKKRLGGDIFIHGDCVTIGCIPITDDLIKELYIIAVAARAQGQQDIPVHIFPFKMNDDMWAANQITFHNKPKLLSFWTNIRPGYLFFEKSYNLPLFTVDNAGSYHFQEN